MKVKNVTYVAVEQDDFRWKEEDLVFFAQLVKEHWI